MGALVGPGLSEREALLLLWYLDAWTSVSDQSPVPWLWLGALEPYWTWEGKARGPMLITVTRFLDRQPKGTRRRRGLCRNEPRRATVPVFLDSGAFSMIDANARWTISPDEYLEIVQDIVVAVETVMFVGIQDWMCEPHMVKKTGLSVREHQRRTVESYLRLRDMDPAIPWLVTLQGHTTDDYLYCAEAYQAAGVELAAQPLVGLGSVCRRSGTRELVQVFDVLRQRLPGVKWHGFGVKSDGAAQACAIARSFDSEAGLKRARYIEMEIRQSLGLPVAVGTREHGAGWRQVLEAVEAGGTIAGDIGRGLFEWKRAAGEEASMSDSLLWAELWRLRQQILLTRAANEAREPELREDQEPARASVLVQTGLIVDGREEVRANVFYADGEALVFVSTREPQLGDIFAWLTANQAPVTGITEIQTDRGFYDFTDGIRFVTWWEDDPDSAEWWRELGYAC